MNTMYYILIVVIVLVVAIDLYLKKKNKKSESTDVDSYTNNKKKKKGNYFNILIYAFLFSIICGVVYLHIQHQSIRNQFEINLKSVSELLKQNKYDYCDSLVTQNKEDLINNSNANNLKYKLNGRYYNSSDLIFSADSLIELIDVLKKDYTLEQEKRKHKQKVIDLTEMAIKTFKIGVEKKEIFDLSRQLYSSKKKLFSILKSLLKIDNKNKFALYHLSNFNLRLASEARFEISDDLQERWVLQKKYLLESEKYALMLVDFYPEYWGGYNLLSSLNHNYYYINNLRRQHDLLEDYIDLDSYLRKCIKYFDSVIEKIGSPINNNEKETLINGYERCAISNKNLGNCVLAYNNVLSALDYGEVFVDNSKYLETKFLSFNRKFKYFCQFDPNNYKNLVNIDGDCFMFEY
tara:strand:- start:193 stop:1410 length:1218 start_codon:yes stop_codon:yes gene_type:complete